MKRVGIILVLMMTGFSLGAVDIINIYGDNNSSLYGVSRERVWLKSIDIESLEYCRTYDTNEEEGVLTAVTASRELFFFLDSALKYEESVRVGTVVLSRELKGNRVVYTYWDNTRGIDFAFSLEKPGEEIFKVIDSVYPLPNKWNKEVKDHYRDTWVIRIFAAENCVNPDVSELDFEDILFTATLIGEKFQWLLGVHDGADFLADLF